METHEEGRFDATADGDTVDSEMADMRPEQDAGAPESEVLAPTETVEAIGLTAEDLKNAIDELARTRQLLVEEGERRLAVEAKLNAIREALGVNRNLTDDPDFTDAVEETVRHMMHGEGDDFVREIAGEIVDDKIQYLSIEDLEGVDQGTFDQHTHDISGETNTPEGY